MKLKLKIKTRKAKTRTLVMWVLTNTVLRSTMLWSDTPKHGILHPVQKGHNENLKQIQTNATK